VIPKNKSKLLFVDEEFIVDIKIIIMYDYQEK